MNILVQYFVCLLCKAMYLFLLGYNKCEGASLYVDTYFKISLGCTLRSRIARSHGKYMMFNILRSFPNIFQSYCTILHFQQICIRVLASLHPSLHHQHLILSWLFVSLFVCHSKKVSYSGSNLHLPTDLWNYHPFMWL